jgi:hypothetical protein
MVDPRALRPLWDRPDTLQEEHTREVGKLRHSLRLWFLAGAVALLMKIIFTMGGG